KGFKEIAGNKSLQQLWVDIWQINDEGVIALAAAGKPHTLLQARTGDTWAGSDAEGRTLSLGGLSGTDASLKALAGLKSLERLYLYGPNISDVGMKDLAALSTLRVLAMGGARITDAGLSDIAGLKSLEVLHIDGAKITDAGMKVIGGFKSLHTLFVYSPAV